MLLILTNSQDATADYLASVLKERGVRFLRFNTDMSVSELTLHCDDRGPRVHLSGEWWAPDAFTNVWYRRPERLRQKAFDDSPEGHFILDEWSEALEGFFAHIPQSRWMNHPSCNASASHKIEQLTTARATGLCVPNTLITQDPTQARDFFAANGGRVVVKPMGRGYIERPGGPADTLIYTNQVLDTHLDDLHDLHACPTLFQQYIDKQFDVRITVVDERLHAAELVASDPDGSQRCDVRRNNMEGVVYREILLPNDVGCGIRKIMNHYSLRFAAIDMVVDKSQRWYFLEINPNGQWAWMDLEGGMNIASYFVEAFVGP